MNPKSQSFLQSERIKEAFSGWSLSPRTGKFPIEMPELPSPAGPFVEIWKIL